MFVVTPPEKNQVELRTRGGKTKRSQTHKHNWFHRKEEF